MLLIASAFISFSQKKQVNTQINFFQPYCGGARPSPEILAEAQKPKPYANKTVIIVSHKGKVDSAKTNASGMLTIELNKGCYKLYEAWRYYKKAAGGMKVSDFEPDCLKAEWKKEFKEVVITKTDVKVNDKNEIIETCPSNLPCILESHKPPARE